MFIDDACSILLIAKMGLIKIYWLMNTILGTGLGDHSAVMVSHTYYVYGVREQIIIIGSSTNIEDPLSSEPLQSHHILLETLDYVIKEPRFSFETSEFRLRSQISHQRPQIFIGDLRFSLETSDFHWRPQIFVENPKLMLGGPNFSLLEALDFYWRLPDFH